MGVHFTQEHTIPCKIQANAKLLFSGAFSQFFQILLPSSCPQFGSNNLIKILTDLDVSDVDTRKKKQAK